MPFEIDFVRYIFSGHFDFQKYSFCLHDVNEFRRNARSSESHNKTRIDMCCKDLTMIHNLYIKLPTTIHNSNVATYYLQKLIKKTNKKYIYGMKYFNA